jgi:hypothetical protein
VPGRSKEARRRLTRGSTPLYQEMKGDMSTRTPVRSDSPRVDSSYMLENNEVANGSVSHLLAEALKCSLFLGLSRTTSKTEIHR